MNITALLDRPIAYHRVFAEIGGSVTAGVFLSQAVYWSQRASDPDGWFWKTQKEWHEETYLKRSEQEIARRELRASGILEEKKKGVPAKLYFRVNVEALANRLLSPVCQDAASKDAEMQHPPSKDAEMQQTRVKSGKSKKSLAQKELEPDFEKTAKDAESSILYLTETTSETSSGINKDPLYPPKGDGGVANAFQEEEGSNQIATPEETIAHEPEEPEQNATLDNKSNPVKDQGSAPRRSPSKAINAIKRQYPDKPPDWRTGYEVGAYCIGFKLFVQVRVIDKLPANSVWSTYTSAQLIEENEASGKFANLEERCKQWQALEATEAAAQTKASHQEYAPPIDLSEPLSKLDVCLDLLKWNRQQAIDHMVENHGWERRHNETHRNGNVFNYRVITDAEILEIQETLEELCTNHRQTPSLSPTP